MQIQIEQTKAGLEQLGVETDYLRWWDDKQSGDVLQHFGRYPTELTEAAQQKGVKVVVADLLTEQGSRPIARIKLQKCLRRVIERIVPGRRLAFSGWKSYQYADACITLTTWEKFLMQELYGVSPNKTHVIPNGVEEVFLRSQPAQRGPWLVCTATITERKRVLELAQAAVAAKAPLRVIGKPYKDSDAYARSFMELAAAHPQTLRYEGPIQDRKALAQVYREARGFVLLSSRESLSLSALEAAACECPLLLSDLPWARGAFGENAQYCPVSSAMDRTAKHVREFYDAAPGLKPPPRPQSWQEVCGQFKSLYEGLLNTSR